MTSTTRTKTDEHLPDYRTTVLVCQSSRASALLSPEGLLGSIMATALLLFLLVSYPVQADATMKTENSLRAIKGWLQEHAPALERQLNPPASSKDIQRFENETGIALPASVRAAYEIHNGESRSSDGLFGTWRWLPLDEVAAYRQELLGTGESLANDAVPVLLSGGGDFYFVESVDAPGGESPVFEWWHEQPARDLVHDTFAAMLQDFAGALERGQYVFLPESLSGLIDKDDL